MSNIITLDVGTSGMKSYVFNEKGSILFTSSSEYSPSFEPPSLVEQNPNDWLEAMTLTLKETGNYINKNNINPEAIAITSQRASVIAVDEKGKVLRDAIMWQDKRTVDICEKMQEKMTMKEIYHKTGLRINPYFSLPRILWIKENEKEIYDKTHKFLGVQDFLVYQLTGEFKTDWSQASRTMLMDIEKFKWDDDIIQTFGLDPKKLCDLVPPGAKVGLLNFEMAKKTGIKEGTPIIISGGDQQNAALALKIIKAKMIQANTGTGSFVMAYSEKPIFDEKIRVICSASAIAGKWIVEAGIFNTGAIYRWFRNQYGYDTSSFDSINSEALESPIGSNGVILIPHFEGSAAPYWNPLAKGLFFNISLGSTRGDMARSIIEGIALEISENVLLIENLVGQMETVSVAGGMTKFDLFNEIQANAFGKDVIKYQNSEATALGASISAFVTLEVYDSFEEAFEQMVDDFPKVISYIPEEALIYQEIRKRKNKLYSVLNDNGVYNCFSKKVY